MGFTEVLTIIFVLLKAFGVIEWSWLVVFTPEILALVVYIFAAIISIKRFNKASKDIFDKF